MTNSEQTPKNGATRIYQLLAIFFMATTAVLAWNITQLKAGRDALQQELDKSKAAEKAFFERSELDKQFVNLVRDTDTKSVSLTDGKSFYAYTYYNALRRETVLDLNGIPMPPDKKYMQFWQVVGGKRVSLGTVNMQSIGSRQSFKFVEGAEAFEISIEDNPNGVEMPTIVILNGKVN